MTEEERPEGEVPHWLPGTDPYLDEVSKVFGIPLEAVRGGPETMYPEYRKKLKDKYVAPAKCTRYCCGYTGGVRNRSIDGCITDVAQNP